MNLPWGQILRPYATFSHPNSLAGYLLVSLVILRQIPAPKVIRHFLIGAIVLTFSKAAIFTLIILELIRPKLIQIILLSAVLGFLPFLRLDPLSPPVTTYFHQRRKLLATALFWRWPSPIHSQSCHSSSGQSGFLCHPPTCPSYFYSDLCGIRPPRCPAHHQNILDSPIKAN